MLDTDDQINSLAALANATKGNRTRKYVLTVPLDDVVAKRQIREHFENIEDLANSIKVEGQQSPIIVYPQNDAGKYVIQKGERRWRACKHAGLSTIDIIINETILNELDEAAGELVENIQREDLRPMEIAKALCKFAEEEWNASQIAERIGKSASYVQQHLRLLDLPACVLKVYARGICTDVRALNNLLTLYQKDEALCVALCERALSTDSLSRADTAKALKEAREEDGNKTTTNDSTQGFEPHNVPEKATGVAARSGSDSYNDSQKTTQPDNHVSTNDIDKTARSYNSQLRNVPSEHSEKSIKKEISASPERVGKKKDAGYRAISPGNLYVYVSFTAGGVECEGRIANHIVSDDQDSVWVEVMTDSGVLEERRVSIKGLTLRRVVEEK